MIRFALFLAAFFACAIYAFRAGGRPERAAIAAQAAALFLSWLSRFSSAFGFFGHLTIHWLVVDLLLLLVLIWIALKANRLWPLALAGLQEAAIFAHIVKAFYPAFAPMAYAILLEIWAWPMLLTTALGTRHHQLRRKAGYSLPDWKPAITLWYHPSSGLSRPTRSAPLKSSPTV